MILRQRVSLEEIKNMEPPFFDDMVKNPEWYIWQSNH